MTMILILSVLLIIIFIIVIMNPHNEESRAERFGLPFAQGEFTH